MNHTPECRNCGDQYPSQRWALGYKFCLPCGDKVASEDRKTWCIVQEYGKGAYQLVTPESAKTTLRQTNQKELRT
jgi:tRNA(Ile2) C34 agmatinyltransferase TiaS